MISAFKNGPLAGLEPLCIETQLNAGDRPDGGATGYAVLSIAISLKRIADVLQGDPQNSGLIFMLDQIAVGVQSR